MMIDIRDIWIMPDWYTSSSSWEQEGKARSNSSRRISHQPMRTAIICKRESVIDLLFPQFYVFLLQLIFMNYKIEIILLDFFSFVRLSVALATSACVLI
jgi:hypothetical protein